MKTIKKLKTIINDNLEEYPERALTLLNLNFVNNSVNQLSFGLDKNTKKFNLYFNDVFFENMSENEIFSSMSYIAELILGKSLSRSNEKEKFRYDLANALYLYDKIDDIPQIADDIYGYLNIEKGKTVNEYYNELKENPTYQKITENNENSCQTFTEDELQEIVEAENNIINYVKEKISEMNIEKEKEKEKNNDFLEL